MGATARGHGVRASARCTHTAPSCALHSAVLLCKVVTSLTITEGKLSLARTLHGRLERHEYHARQSGEAHSKTGVELAARKNARDGAGGAKITFMNTRVGIVTDKLERVALWEQWLGEAAAETKQRCWHCALRRWVLKRIPGLTGLGNWWCCS